MSSGTSTGTSSELGVGMVGYAFMGAAHSQAWRTAPRFFDLPLVPRMRAVAGRDAAAVRAAADAAGLGRRRHRLARAADPGRRRAGRRLYAGRHARRDRDRRAGGGQARPVREAAGQHAWPRRRRWPPRPRSRRSGACSRWWGSPTVACPPSRWPGSWSQQGRIGEVRHVRAQYLQDWIADPQAPMSWRLDKQKAGSGALGDIGAHVVDLAQYVTGESLTGCERPARDLRARAPGGGVVLGPVGCGRRRPHRARSRWTTPRCSSGGCPAAGWRPSRRRASPGAARTRSGWRSTGRRARWPSTSRT